MLPHHHRSGCNHPKLPPMAATADTPCGRERWWRQRLALAVLALPLSVPVFFAYQIIAAPVMLFAMLISRRNMCSLPLRLLRALPLEMFWFPFWRLCTNDGSQRCEYVDMSVTEMQPRSTRCAVEGLPPKPPGCARLVLLSDTHGKHDWVDVPNGDVLCHTGDITVGWQNRWCTCRSLAALRAFDTWLGDLPHRHKVVIGGNHDSVLEELVSQGISVTGQVGGSQWGAARPFENAIYLENSGIVLQMADGKTLHVWGTPWSSPGRSANQAYRARSANMINPSAGVDLLLSHSKLPREVLERVAPRLHACGHFHSQHGAIFVDYQQHQSAATNLTNQTEGIHLTLQQPIAPPAGDSRRLEVNCAVCDADLAATQPVFVVDLPVDSPACETTAKGNGASTEGVGLSYWKGFGKMMSRITG